jgi:hypothetical protein
MADNDDTGKPIDSMGIGGQNNNDMLDTLHKTRDAIVSTKGVGIKSQEGLKSSTVLSDEDAYKVVEGRISALGQLKKEVLDKSKSFAELRNVLLNVRNIEVEISTILQSHPAIAGSLNISGLMSEIISAAAQTITHKNSLPPYTTGNTPADEAAAKAELEKLEKDHESREKIRNSKENVENICDAFDALEERRKKNPAWSSEKAEEMAEKAANGNDESKKELYEKLSETKADMRLSKAMFEIAKEELELEAHETVEMAKRRGLPVENMQELKDHIELMTDEEKQQGWVKEIIGLVGQHDDMAERVDSHKGDYKKLKQDYKVLAAARDKFHLPPEPEVEVEAKFEALIKEANLKPEVEQKVVAKALEKVAEKNQETKIKDSEAMNICQEISKKCDINSEDPRYNTPEKFFAELHKKINSTEGKKLLADQDIADSYEFLKETYPDAIKDTKKSSIIEGFPPKDQKAISDIQESLGKKSPDKDPPTTPTPAPFSAKILAEKKEDKGITG